MLRIAASIIGFFLFWVPLSIHAQNQADTLYFAMDTLQVEAVRSRISSTQAPLSLSIKTRSVDERTADGSSSLNSLTYDLPGIWVNDRQNNALGEKVTIRGIGWRAAFGVRGVQMVLDGIPLTTADGQSITNIIDPAFINRVELIRGPAASYWGNSSGGVLYLSSGLENQSNNHGYIRSYGGSFENRKLDVQLRNTWGQHRVNTYTSYQSSEGYRNYSKSKLLRSGINGSYNFKDHGRLQYNGAFVWMPEAQHPSGLTAEQVQENPQQARTSFVESDAGKQVTQGQLGLSYDRNTAAGLLTVSGYGTYRDLTNPLPFGIITVNRLAGGLRSSLDFTINSLTIRGGAELKYQHDDREEFENDNGSRGATTVNQLETVSNQALFATANYELGRFTLLGSLRFDRITFASDSASNIQTGDRTFQALSPGFGLSYNTGSSILYTNISTSFEAPTTTELVNRPDGGNGFNPNLKPERTIGVETGSRGTLADNILEYDLTFYQLWIQDLLFPFQLETDGATFFRNQGETRHRGIEVSATVHPADVFSIASTYTLTDAEFVKAQTLGGTSLKDNTVPGVAKHRISTSANWSPGAFFVQTSGRYVSSFPVNNLNTASNENYIRFDAKLSYNKEFSQSGITLTPFVNVNNIFDEQYNGSVFVNAFGGQFYEPAPGRNWSAGLSMQF